MDGDASHSRTLQIFYGISSPWAYLGAQRAYAIAERTGAALELRPIRVIQANGGIPLRSRPQARQDYHDLELRRWSRHVGIPLNPRPLHYPCRTIEPAAMSVIAVLQADLDARGYSFAVQRALWAEDRDIADRDTLHAIALAELGAEQAAQLDFGHPPPRVEQDWQENLAEAERLGIFGTPTYVVDSELFWGQDRLDFVERALRGEG